MHSLRSRYILSHIVPLLVTAPLVMVVLLYLLEAQVFLRDLSDDLAQQAQLIAQATADSAEIWENAAAAERYLTIVGSTITGEIAFLDADGNLLAATDGFAGDTLDLTRFPELQAGEMSVSLRYSLANQSAEILQPVYDIDQQLTGVIRVTDELQNASTAVVNLRRFVFGALLIELLVGALIGLYLATRMSNRIQTVTENVVGISRGEHVADISAEGATEIRVLYEAVNDLSHQLIESENTRRHLLANLIHELGRPLGAIRAAVDALRHGAADEPVLRDELLLGIEQHIVQMEPLLDDLSHLHGQILGTRALNRQPTDINEWLPPFLLPWRAAAIEKGLTWSAEIDPHLPIMTVDVERLGQAVGNLLATPSNTQPEGGNVAIRAQQHR